MCNAIEHICRGGGRWWLTSFQWDENKVRAEWSDMPWYDDAVPPRALRPLMMQQAADRCLVPPGPGVEISRFQPSTAPGWPLDFLEFAVRGLKWTGKTKPTTALSQQILCNQFSGLQTETGNTVQLLVIPHYLRYRVSVSNITWNIIEIS